MCPLKRSFGCQPDASTNGLIHWRRTRNANLLSASQLRVSMAALLFVCVPAAIIFLWKMEGGVSIQRTLPSCNEQTPHIYVFTREHLNHKRG